MDLLFKRPESQTPLTYSKYSKCTDSRSRHVAISRRDEFSTQIYQRRLNQGRLQKIVSATKEWNRVFDGVHHDDEGAAPSANANGRVSDKPRRLKSEYQTKKEAVKVAPQQNSPGVVPRGF
jgi:hypothetical protein